MKIIKNTLFIVFIVFSLLMIYVVRIKYKYDIVYANRSNPMLCQELYNSGALNSLLSCINNKFDSIGTIPYSKVHDTLDIEISLSALKKNGYNKECVSKLDMICRKGFSNVKAVRIKNTGVTKIYMDNKYLQYRKIPTYHCLIYDKEGGYSYRFNKDDNWYFFSFDDNEHDFHNFLDFRPEWSFPYFEAFEFFKKNPTYMDE